jgi:hypothetical protein
MRLDNLELLGSRLQVRPAGHLGIAQLVACELEVAGRQGIAVVELDLIADADADDGLHLMGITFRDSASQLTVFRDGSGLTSFPNIWDTK